MGKCYTILLLSALLVSSMCAAAPVDYKAPNNQGQTSPDNSTTPSPELLATTSKEPTPTVSVESKSPEVTNAPPLIDTSHSGEIGQLIHKFAKFFDAMTLSDLKLLEKTIVDKKDMSEFQGLLGGLIDDDGKDVDGEDVFSMLGQLKNYQLLHGILTGQISRKERLNPVSISPETSAPPSKEPPSQSNGQSSSIKSQLDEDVEKLVEQQLLAAMKMLPVEDLKRIRNLHAQGNVPSQTLKNLQPAILSDELINFAVKYPSELKAAIDEAIFEDGLEGVTQPAAPTTVEPSKPAQTVTVSDGQISVPEADKKENLTIKDEVNLLEPDDYETEIEELDGKLSEEEQIENVNQNIEDATQKEKESTKFINLKPQDTLIEDTPQQTPVESGGWFGAWHFLIIFLLIAALVGIGYFCSHNRKKIREGVGSYVSNAASKGRRSRNYRYKPVSST